ncbi:MAG: DNA/RNA nuclease SfsA [Firmicutes bacterium HGW-Firmicutes-11]|jgi:sugar fermentation stimulation protein A|nr:MAG: DNA/RNA nuclease SfsA [Firmicutes bacterium HGW-Firmicutes-11]
MKYETIVPGKFVSRPNRFIAIVSVDGTETEAHIKNTGRFKELLIPGAAIYLEDHQMQNKNTGRRTRYSLISVEKENRLVNIDSSASNLLVKESLLEGSLLLPGVSLPLRSLRPESVFYSSRFDFYFVDREGKTGFLEVKTVTLEEDDVARFPDAPTLRGIRHLEELVKAKAHGHHAILLFVIQTGRIHGFEPNDATHRAFGDALRKAKEAGITIEAIQCQVDPDGISLTTSVPVSL